MILQALTQHYEDLLKRGEIASQGWSPAKITYALCINADGELERIFSVEEEVPSGKKTVLQPQRITLPAAVKRSSNPMSNFLWDNSAYLLGVDQKGNPERAKKCFDVAKERHHKLLDGLNSETARAILSFFDHWNPDEAKNHPALQEKYEEITSGKNLLFRVEGKYAQKDPEICAAWQRNLETNDPNAVRMQCLVTGRKEEIPLIHDSIKGVRNAQSSGAALVSFNAPAFCSYGKEQNQNAPVGKYAAFAYTAALNALLADYEHVMQIGDTTVVCWVEGGEPEYQDVWCTSLGNESKTLTESDVMNAVKYLAAGQTYEPLSLDPNRPFYILGLAPNAARLSVRFFYRNTFGALMRNVNDHNERLKIVGAKYETIPLWALLQATVNMNSREKTASPAMAGATARAIFSGTRYPASLLESVMLRIRAERDITWNRAAILKAYYLKNEHKDCPKEVLTVSLNENSTNPAYTLGRLFAVYEAAQQAANPGINATIRDKYLNAASAMPASIFPILANLYQKHLRKLSTGQQIYYNKLVGQLKDILGEEYPVRLNLAQQGSFDLGYYHQMQKRYEKKEEQ